MNGVCRRTAKASCQAERSGTGEKRASCGVEASLCSPRFPRWEKVFWIVSVRTAVYLINTSEFQHGSRSPLLLRLHNGQSVGSLVHRFQRELAQTRLSAQVSHFEGFTARYDVTRLLYWESYGDVHRALARETQLKGWTRAKKIGLIVRRNPHWAGLAAEWYPWVREEGRDASTPQ
jgi:predicted GIY-YIG superfamily endonuclease